MNTPTRIPDEGQSPEMAHPCVLCFNSNDPSGAGGLTADILAMSSVGSHVLAISTGSYVRDTAEVFDHVAMDEDCEICYQCISHLNWIAHGKLR